VREVGRVAARYRASTSTSTSFRCGFGFAAASEATEREWVKKTRIRRFGSGDVVILFRCRSGDAMLGTHGVAMVGTSRGIGLHSG
jgi:hypothetical protein